MIPSVDVCVIGGGIMGLSIAHELVRRGRQVTVLEASGIGERAATGTAAGMLAPASEADLADPRLTEFALASHELYPQWINDIESESGLETGFDQAGTVWVALHRDHAVLIDRLCEFQRERGLHAEPQTTAQLRAIEPMVSPGAVGGILLHDDWQVDPRKLLTALTTLLRQAGATIEESSPVDCVRPGDAGFEVSVKRDGEQQVYHARQVVLAAGAWTHRIKRESIEPQSPLPLRPVKGQVVRLRGNESIIDRVVRTPDVYIVPRSDGELVIGATMDEHGFDDRPTAGGMLDLLREAWRTVPGIYELEFVETTVAFRPALRDHLPSIGALEMPGLFIATGHYRNGIELAPITAKLTADLVCDDTADSALLEALKPDRFVAAKVHA